MSRLLRSDPALARTRFTRDRLFDAIPHWLYAGDTPLHLAAAGLRTEVARLLLEAGAEPDAANRRGATPLHYACDPRPRSGGTWDPRSQSALIRTLVRGGADVDRADRGGATPLHRAVRARSVAAVRALLALRARTDRVLKTRRSTALHLAVQPTGAGGTAGTLREQLDIVALLLRHGADPAAADVAGRTPRDWAANETLAEALRAGRARRRR